MIEWLRADVPEQTFWGCVGWALVFGAIIGAFIEATRRGR